MSMPLQPISMMPLPQSIESKGFSAASLQQALALEGSLGSQAAGQAMGGSNALLPLDKSSLLNPLSGPAQHTDAQLREVSKNFESIFMRMLFKEMRNTVEKSNALGNSRSMEFFENMRDEQLSDSLASAGGIGIGKMIYQKLKETTLPHQKMFK